MTLAALVLLLAGATAASKAAATRGLRTAVVANSEFVPSNDDLQFARIKGTGASAVRLDLNWTRVAPKHRPPNFDPRDPSSRAYDWDSADSRIRFAHAHGLDPIVLVSGAPSWAEGEIPRGTSHTERDGPYRPSPDQFGKFARAAALRYDGSFRDDEGVKLPRVRYWIAWNEPNIYRYLTPQNLNGKPFSPEWYRRMVNAFSSSVHSVHSDNLVVAGATAPFGISRRISPLRFMRLMLCMSEGPRPHPTCSHTASFDIWSHHPYTRGNAFHTAVSPDDVSLGDLPEMHALVNAAAAAHHIVSKRRAVGLWVDEFGWDSRPPSRSRYTVPTALHARWTAEALYQMWRSGVSLATWFLLRDEPVGASLNQTGLWFIGSPPDNMHRDRPKPSLYAFRFPFVAYRDDARVSIWGRTPTSTGGSIAIEARMRSGWRRVGRLHAGGNGVFVGKLRFGPIEQGASRPDAAMLRAQYRDLTSRAFSLEQPRDRFVLPFA